MTTVLTLALDAASQERFEALRQEHYPAALNRIPAHVSLFHQLPGTDEVQALLQQLSETVPEFQVTVSGVRSLGRGVAFQVAAPELGRLHAELSRRVEPWLTKQDRQRFQPHVVVQNKVPAHAARELLAKLQASALPGPAQAEGLDWWEYLGGPWRLIERFRFQRLA